MNSSDNQLKTFKIGSLILLLSLSSVVSVPAFADTPISKQSSLSTAAKHPEIIVKADTLIAQKKFDDAISILTQHLKKEPSNALCLARRGAVHNQVGHYKQCVEDLNRAFAVTNNGRDLDSAAGYLIMRAYANLRLENKAAARADIEKVEKLQPNTGQHWHIRGLIEEKWGSPKEALKFYEKSLSIDPSNDSCLGHATALATKLNAVAQKEKLINECVRRSPDAFNLTARAQLNASCMRWKEVAEDTRSVLKLDPKSSVGVYQLHSHALTALGKPQQVLASTARGLKQYPDDPGLKFFRASALSSLGKDAEAIEICNQLKKQSPDMAEPYELLGHIYKTQKRYEESADEFRKGAKVHEPQSAMVLLERATAFRNGENYEEAARDFEKVFAIQHTAEHLLRAGECYIGLSDYKSALRTLDLSLDPKVPVAMSSFEKSHAYTRKALCYSRLNNPRKAREAANQALAIDPKSATAMHFHAESSIKLKDIDAAIKDYTEMIKLQPNFARNYGERAKLYKMKGQFALAQRDLNTVARLSTMVEEETFPKKVPGRRVAP